MEVSSLGALYVETGLKILLMSFVMTVTYHQEMDVMLIARRNWTLYVMLVLLHVRYVGMELYKVLSNVMIII